MNDAEQRLSNSFDPFGELANERNQSFEASQRLDLAAAEHYYDAQWQARNGPLGALGAAALYLLYDGGKYFGNFVALGAPMRLLSSGKYPPTNPTFGGTALAMCGAFSGQ